MNKRKSIVSKGFLMQSQDAYQCQLAALGRFHRTWQHTLAKTSLDINSMVIYDNGGKRNTAGNSAVGKP